MKRLYYTIRKWIEQRTRNHIVRFSLAELWGLYWMESKRGRREHCSKYAVDRLREALDLFDGTLELCDEAGTSHCYYWFYRN